ncbi:GPI mannosyltransferase 1 [Patella vulgata]|uniref:GPI mannosyltransferase 1 n=1 Tax=Patella vulgata TaxID=6465 RepID=UPI00217FC291|nr:GPI mannosyltransferase 1 [Patella vulgata]XP_050395745.1 GPI mannosyltransferase 1 [Patella vulgata]XP_050395747.1 GPI mannosyltransferase 1 [Patella vulgata]
MLKTVYTLSIFGYCVIALLLRLALIGYGEWQDRTLMVKFTDVDYKVFSDAAHYVHQGKSPYNRSTYRYTPILAYMLLPNITVTPLFGKVMFSVFDILTGYLIYLVLKHQKYSIQQAQMYSCLWLYNPLPMAVSSRGNAESVMTALVMICMMSLCKKQVILSALLYGLTVHFKIYPVTYALTIYFHLSHPSSKTDHYIKKVVNLFLPNKDKVYFVLVSVLTLVLLTVVFYHWYGWKFLYESYIYHIVRKDIRHNFSPFFYMLYLTAEQDSVLWMKLLVFLPQLCLVLAFSMKYYTDLPMSWFLITFAFVTTNKVCTSQYFLWYLSLLPLIIPSIQMSIRRATVLTITWFLGQAVWLQAAYLLEFKGQNTFIWIWMAGLLFFTINFNIIYNIIEYYKPLMPVPSYLSKKRK